MMNRYPPTDKEIEECKSFLFHKLVQAGYIIAAYDDAFITQLAYAVYDVWRDVDWTKGFTFLTPFGSAYFDLSGRRKLLLDL